MKTKLILAGLFITMLAGCSSDDVFSANENQPEEELCEVASSQNVMAIKKYISKHHSSASRSTENLLYPYIVDGDTVMYIANYGEGWEIFSNDPRVPMVLMKCEDGSFYPTAFNIESPFEAFFQNTAEYLNTVKKSDFAATDTINTEWLAYGLETLDLPGDEYDSNEYHWKLVATSSENYYHREYVPAGGRIVTKWSQEGNFALFTPFKDENKNIHAYVGCVAVAIAQYLYFTHYKDNCPENTVTEAIYDSKNNLYRFSGSSSTVWDSFATSYQSDSASMASTAIFLGWVGHKVIIDYKGSSGGSILNSGTLKFFNDQTRLNASISEYSKYSTKEILSKGYPVIVRAISDSNNKGHAWLIDYCESEGYTYNDYYAYIKRKQSPETDDAEEIDGDFIVNPTIEGIKAIYGDVDIEIKTHIVDKSYLMCNWGWGGYCDNVKIDANILSWSVSGYVYNKEHKIYYFK